jgi:hypothetical protein
LNSVQFGPIGQPFGISGTSGYHPKFTSQQTLGNGIIYDTGTDIGIGTTTPSSYGPGITLYRSVNSTLGLTVINPSATSAAASNIVLGTAVSGGTYGYIQYNGASWTGTSLYDSPNTLLMNSSNNDLLLGSNAAYNIRLFTNNTERVRVTSTGNVGVGVTPSTANYGGTYGLIAAGNGSGYGIFSGQTTATATDSIAAAFAAVTTGASTFKSLGTVGIYVDGTSTTNAAGRIAFAVGDGAGAQPERMRITSAGNVGIGTTSPSFKLQVDAASVDANIVANVTSGYGGIGIYAAGTNKVVLGYAGSNANYGSQTIAGDIALKVNNSNFHINTGSGNSVTTAYFSSAGNVGIGTTSPSTKLHVDSGVVTVKNSLGDYLLMKRTSDNATVASMGVAAGSVEFYISALTYINLDHSGGGVRLVSWNQWADTVSAETFWIKNSNLFFGQNSVAALGRTAFNTTNFQITAGSYATIPAPTSRFEVYGDSQFVSQSTSAKTIIVKAAASQSANLTEWQNNGGTALAYMDSGGNFFAVSKSFLIDHPTPAKAAEGKKLRYASLEGPENGVYFRGRLEGENEIVLPDYWKDLVDPESITVNLTPRKRPQPNLFVVDANGEKVVVESDREICCDFIVYGTRKDIAKLEVEVNGN